jgi:predicted membrane protein (TIGR00267 family)
VVLNAFDGAVTALGLIMGFFISDVNNVRVIVITVLATAFALFISGFWSAYLTEEAERTREILKLEKQLLHSLKNSKMAKATKIIALEAALVDGLSPALVAIFLTTPFLLVWLNLLALSTAFYISVALALLVLVLLGVFLSTISNQSIVRLVLKMLLAGLLAIGFSFLLESIGTPVEAAK